MKLQSGRVKIGSRQELVDERVVDLNFNDPGDEQFQ
jgi:hypothetical protein